MPKSTNPEASIRQLQQMLDQLSRHHTALPRLAVTGIFDEPTLESVMIFQRDTALPVTGAVDHDTWYAIVHASQEDTLLYGDPSPLRVLPDGGFSAAPGESGSEVGMAQTILCALSNRLGNFSPCPMDQINQGQTQQQLRTLQQLAGLPVTGALDRSTWEYLTRLYHLFVTRDGQSDPAE